MIISLSSLHHPYARSICKGRNGFFLLSESARTVPDDPLNIATGELFKGFFSLPVQHFVLEILSNVFHQSDFETKIATTRVRFILNRSIMVRLSRGR
jgi:hypothetical protein